jgi:hypothetical protein
MAKNPLLPKRKTKQKFIELDKSKGILDDHSVRKSSQVGDHVDGETPQVVNIVYGTDATPPSVTDCPIGTLYIQYTA